MNKFSSIILPSMFLLLLLSAVTGVHAQNNVSISSVKVNELVERYKNTDGIMVVNFWSTWCKPCIEEIPHFIATTDKMKADNVKLLLVSLDTKELYTSGKLQQYVQKKNWDSAPLVWLNETDANYYCPKVDRNWSGAIPATIIIRPSKNYYRFYEESLSRDELAEAIKKAISG